MQKRDPVPAGKRDRGLRRTDTGPEMYCSFRYSSSEKQCRIILQ